MKKTIIFALLFLLTYNSGFAQSLNTMEGQEVDIETPIGKLYGTLRLPKACINPKDFPILAEKTSAGPDIIMKDLPVPLVILITGSGPTDRDGNQPTMKINHLKMVCDSLFQYGVATLSYDKRFSGKALTINQKNETITLDDYISDLELWIDAYKDDPRFSEIILMGHSEGSLIGMLAAQKKPEVKKFISLCGSGRPFQETLREQLNERLQDQPAELKEQVFGYINNLEQGKRIDNISPIWYNLFHPNVQPFLISCFKYDPQKEIAKLNIPSLIISGTTDIQVSPIDANLLKEGAKDGKLVSIENMTHTLKYCDTKDMPTQMKTYSDSSLPLSQNLIPEILRFIYNDPSLFPNADTSK